MNYNYPDYLVSVVIPCYNQGRFLNVAIESVLAQSYHSVEIIVVDDGSVDNTKEVALSYPQVKYLYQQNSGLSAARNTGIMNASGEYLVFLDSDDWLYPHAIETNVILLHKHPEIVFVSGAFERFFETSGKIIEVKQDIKSDHYSHLLHHNYIGMIATVLFRRWVFDEFLYDTTLKACEDYDLYLNIVRKYPVLHHTKKLATYRIHSASMSADVLFMLQTILMVKDRHKSQIRTKAEWQYFHNGNKFCKSYYYNELYKLLIQKSIKADFHVLQVILWNKPKYIIRYILDIIKKGYTNIFQFSR